MVPTNTHIRVFVTSADVLRSWAVIFMDRVNEKHVQLSCFIIPGTL